MCFGNELIYCSYGAFGCCTHMYGIARIAETLYQNNVNNNDDSHPYIISYNMYMPDVF